MSDINPILKEYTEEVKRHISVLKKDFDRTVQTVAEQYNSIDEKLDSHGKKLDSHGKRLDSIDEKLDSHGKRLDSIDEKLDSHGKRLDSIDEKLDSHTEMIDGIKEDITVIKMDTEFVKNSLKKKVDAEEFEILEKRVGVLEAKFRMA